MKERLIASRYGKALICVAKEENIELDRFVKEIERFITVWEREEKIRVAVLNPLIPKKERRELLMSLLNRLSLSKFITNTIILMFERGRLNILEELKEYLLEYQERLSDKLKAELIVAERPSLKEIKAIEDILREKIDKKVELKIKIDPSIIAGFVLRVGDRYYDASLKAKLNNLKSYLLNYYR